MAPELRSKKRAKPSSSSTSKPAATSSKKRKISPEAPVAEDDSTAALFQGFESSGGDESSEEESGRRPLKVPDIPRDSNTEKQLQSVKSTANAPGTIYVGRIPHGFYEHEMRAYFSQFGDITRLRLSRNRKTGRSKHYAFIEFGSAEVAEIVAKTMNNYLLFGHILKCQVVPQEQLHETLWKGANKRFRKIPWNKLEGKKLEAARSREQWEKKVEVEIRKRLEKQEKLKAIGYDYDAPALKRIDQVPQKEVPLPIDSQAHEETPSQVTAVSQDPVSTAVEADEEQMTRSLVKKDEPNIITASEEIVVKKGKGSKKGGEGRKSRASSGSLVKK
ncbi:MAG: hypothetical protein M1817_004006 [Caeruleum heppii]|nr:MAG: hypothetical protein M1817_004006 [Caeruleum heppii]